MKGKYILRRIALFLAALIIIGTLGFVVWAKTGTYYAGEVALSALETSDKVTIKQDKWIIFEPTEEKEIGLVFYPGGLVDPRAYAPVLWGLSEQCVRVVIVPMPLNFAIFNTGAANDVIEAYPEISEWIIAGHSLGGASAAIFADKNSEKITKIALWDSYPPNSADLSDNSLEAISIFGTTNGTPNTDNFNERKYLMPDDTVFIAIEGANHAQFGDYGPQKGDVIAKISQTEQHKRVVEIMLDFINQQ